MVVYCVKDSYYILSKKKKKKKRIVIIYDNYDRNQYFSFVFDYLYYILNIKLSYHVLY